MTKKVYNILLDGDNIGTTELENADAPMGIVFGKIKFFDIKSGYDFFKNYCLRNRIEITFDDEKERVIATRFLPTMKVVNQDGLEIEGLGTYINGMDIDIFTIYIFGISYPFYEEQFPNHVKVYNNKFIETKT